MSRRFEMDAEWLKGIEQRVTCWRGPLSWRHVDGEWEVRIDAADGRALTNAIAPTRTGALGLLIFRLSEPGLDRDTINEGFRRAREVEDRP